MKRISVFVLMVVVMMFGFSSCGASKERTIEVCVDFINDSLYYENEEDIPIHVKPEFETITVKKGDELFYSIKISKVTDDSITIKCDYPYYAYIRTLDGEFVEEVEDNAKKITVKVGQEVSIGNAGICDATETTYIRVVG